MNSQYSFRSRFNRIVAQCIAKGQILPELYVACQAVSENFNEVVEHIGAEVTANR
jgi:hypothetical protein